MRVHHIENSPLSPDSSLQKGCTSRVLAGLTATDTAMGVKKDKMDNIERLRQWVFGEDESVENLSVNSQMEQGRKLFDACTLEEAVSIAKEGVAHLSSVNSITGPIKEERTKNGTLLFDAIDRLANATNDSEKLSRVEEVCRLYRRRLEIDAIRDSPQLGKIKIMRGRYNTLTEWIGARSDSEAIRSVRDSALLRRKAAQEEKQAAEYAALLAQGRKRQTLQQAYANGDYIEVTTENQVCLPSSTGKRLGARG